MEIITARVYALIASSLLVLLLRRISHTARPINDKRVMIDRLACCSVHGSGHDPPQLQSLDVSSDNNARLRASQSRNARMLTR